MYEVCFLFIYDILSVNGHLISYIYICVHYSGHKSLKCTSCYPYWNFFIL